MNDPSAERLDNKKLNFFEKRFGKLPIACFSPVPKHYCLLKCLKLIPRPNMSYLVMVLIVSYKMVAE